MNKYLLIIFMLMSINKAYCAESNKLIESINESKKITYVSWDLMMGGSQVFKFKNQDNKLIFVRLAYERIEKKIVFMGIKFGTDEVSENYVTKEALGANFDKLKGLVDAIDKNTIISEEQRMQFEHLVEKLNE